MGSFPFPFPIVLEAGIAALKYCLDPLLAAILLAISFERCDGIDGALPLKNLELLKSEVLRPALLSASLGFLLAGSRFERLSERPFDLLPARGSNGFPTCLGLLP